MQSVVNVVELGERELALLEERQPCTCEWCLVCSACLSRVQEQPCHHCHVQAWSDVLEYFHYAKYELHAILCAVQSKVVSLSGRRLCTEESDM